MKRAQAAAGLLGCALMAGVAIALTATPVIAGMADVVNWALR